MVKNVNLIRNAIKDANAFIDQQALYLKHVKNIFN